MVELCVVLDLLDQNIGFGVDVTVNGDDVYHTDISAINPPPICLDNVPEVSKVGNVCIQFYDTNVSPLHVCVRVVLEAFFHNFSWDIGCL